MKNNYWKTAMYFILFEFTFWSTAKEFQSFIYDLIFYSEFDFNYKIILSFIGIIISFWCFKQFIKEFSNIISNIIKSKT